MSSSRLRALALVVVLGVAFAVPRTARACDPAFECTQPLVLPVDGSTIPANATELLVLLRGGSLGESSAARLVAADGSEIALTAVFPSFPGPGIARLHVVGLLVEGATYRVEGLALLDACGLAAPPSVRFLVGPPAAPPTGAGSLRVGEQGIREAGGGCGDTFDESVADLSYAEDPSIAPWRALAFGELIVDGSSLGGVGPLVSSWRAARSCEDDDATTRTASLVVTVAGVSRDETNAVDFDLGCSSFEGCSVARTRRAPRPTPTPGALFVVFAAGVCAVARRSRR